MGNRPVEVISLTSRTRVSVVIPHFYPQRGENLSRLVEDLKKQSFRDLEILIVHGVSPQGKAINEGARKSKGEILVVMDDDSQMGHARVIENLVRVIEGDRTIAMAGASILPPENANWFQRVAATQFPRFGMPVMKKVTESDLACHGCVAFRKDIFVKVGMEREEIPRGLDPDLRVRFRKAGYRVVLAPETWAYHPLPATFLKFIRLFLRNGYGSAYLQVFHPEWCYDTEENLSSTEFVPKRSFLHRLVRFPLRLGKALASLQWVRFLGYSVYAVGYLAGWVRFSLFFGRSH